MTHQADPCPDLTAQIRADMAESALDVLRKQAGDCAPEDLAHYGFSPHQIAACAEAAISDARKRRLDLLVAAAGERDMPHAEPI